MRKFNNDFVIKNTKTRKLKDKFLSKYVYYSKTYFCVLFD